MHLCIICLIKTYRTPLAITTIVFRKQLIGSQAIDLTFNIVTELDLDIGLLPIESIIDTGGRFMGTYM